MIRKGWSQVEGTLVGSTDSGVTLARGAQTVFVSRDKIRKVRIWLKSGAETGEKIGVEAAFVATLVALLAVAGASHCDGAPEELLELAAVGGGKVGSALGGLFDTYQTVYVSARK